MPKKLPYKTNWTPNREELAWAAGFVDGEGCFSIATGSETAQIRARFNIVQAESGAETMCRFQNALPFGAQILGPYTNRNPNAQAQYWYTLSGFEDVQALLALLWTWLSPVKRAQAKAVLGPARVRGLAIARGLIHPQNSQRQTIA